MDYDNVVFTVFVGTMVFIGDLCHSVSFPGARFSRAPKRESDPRLQSLSETGIGNESLWNGHTSERNCMSQSSRSFELFFKHRQRAPKSISVFAFRATNVEMMVIFTLRGGSAIGY